MTFLLKMYEVSVAGFTPHNYPAASPGKARAQAFRAYGRAYSRCTFKEFLQMSSVRRVREPDGFGEAIIVSGAPAYRVTGVYSGPYVAFVRPGSDQVLRSHALDVETARAA